MFRSPDEVAIFSIGAKPQATFTVTAATDLVTSNAHGLSNGDVVQVASGTTLPAGLSANTNYYVFNVTNDTFQLAATYQGAAVDITDTGDGTHTYYLKGKKIQVRDFSHIDLSFNTANSANMTFKVQGSNQADVNLNVAQSSTNRWDYIEIIDLEDGAAIDGDTGVSLAGTDDHRMFEINVNGLEWITVNLTAWAAGNLEVRAKGFFAHRDA